jgi:uncharacterized protein (DUF2235 family)
MALYAFDGTWNEDEEGEGQDSNVVKFRDAYQGERFYLEGVGTRKGFIGKVLGGVAGAGARIRIKEARKAMERNFEQGDETIDIVGFSRGAALALHFANKVHKRFDGAPIRFLALFDVVASFGIPGNRINIAWKLRLPDNVEKCCHAMALDERRGNFPLTRIRARAGGRSTVGRLEEVWFRGVHSDVGGGKNVELSSIALSWMIRRAIEAGVPMSEDMLAQHEALRNEEGAISKNFDPLKDPARTIEEDDVVHASVHPRGDHGGRFHNDPPEGLTTVA